MDPIQKKGLTIEPMVKFKNELLERGVKDETIDVIIMYMLPAIEEFFVEYIYEMLADEVLDKIHSSTEDSAQYWLMYSQELKFAIGKDLNEVYAEIWEKMFTQFLKLNVMTETFLKKVKSLTIEEIQSDEFMIDLLNEVFKYEKPKHLNEDPSNQPQVSQQNLISKE